MRHWITRWLDWAMNDLLPLARTRPRGQAVHVRYEKAGLAVYDAPVPWNADAVVVEALLRLPPSARRKTDFTLRFPGGPPLAPEAMRPEPDDRHRLLFRLPTPAAPLTGELLWKHHLLARVAVPFLPSADFLASLELRVPTVGVRLNDQVVAAQTFVATQCRGLVATAVLAAPTPLAPLADGGVRAVFRNERTGTEHAVPVPLTTTQLGAKEAVLTALPPKVPRRLGPWSVSWVVGGRTLARRLVQGIPARQFEASLRVSDTRFVVADRAGGVQVARQVPPPAEVARLGPCFLVASGEAGMAGVCKLAVYAVVAGDGGPTLLREQDVLVTDGPTLFAPGFVDAPELAKLTGFELRHKGRVLGVLSLSPVPRATLNAEGGFKPPPDFAWSSAADEELNERLQRLMNGGGG